VRRSSRQLRQAQSWSSRIQTGSPRAWTHGPLHPSTRGQRSQAWTSNRQQAPAASGSPSSRTRPEKQMRSVWTSARELVWAHGDP